MRRRGRRRPCVYESKTVAVYGEFYGVTYGDRGDHDAIIIYLGNRNWLPFNRYLPFARGNFNDTRAGRVEDSNTHIARLITSAFTREDTMELAHAAAHLPRYIFSTPKPHWYTVLYTTILNESRNYLPFRNSMIQSIAFVVKYSTYVLYIYIHALYSIKFML